MGSPSGGTNTKHDMYTHIIEEQGADVQTRYVIGRGIAKRETLELIIKLVT